MVSVCDTKRVKAIYFQGIFPGEKNVREKEKSSGVSNLHTTLYHSFLRIGAHKMFRKALFSYWIWEFATTRCGKKREKSKLLLAETTFLSSIWFFPIVVKEETNSQSPFFYCRTKKRKTKEDIFSREEIPDDNQNAIILFFINRFKHISQCKGIGFFVP